MGTTPPTHACAVCFMNFCAETKFEKGASDRNLWPVADYGGPSLQKCLRIGQGGKSGTRSISFGHCSK